MRTILVMLYFVFIQGEPPLFFYNKKQVLQYTGCSNWNTLMNSNVWKVLTTRDLINMGVS